jgi:Ca2+:H+ antiporter
MTLAAMAILIPSIVAAIGGGKFVAQSVNFSIIVSIILLAVYLLSLVFSLGTHVHLFHGEQNGAGEVHGAPWSMSLAIGVMVVVTLLIVWMSEILVATVEHAGHALGLTNLFVGVVIVAVVGNAPSTARRC